MTDVAVDPGLRRLWERVAVKLQGNGLLPTGTVRLADLDREERRALAGLFGSAVTGSRLSVDLARLDERLRAVRGRGLVATVEAQCGPLVDRVAVRRADGERRAAVWIAARRALDRHGLGDRPWAEAWLEDLRAGGTLARAGPERATVIVEAAAAALAALPLVGGSEDRPGRTELATRVSGTSHGLDDGRVLAAIVLRGVARMIGVAYPDGAAGRRALWEAAGVLSDEVSTTVLTLGLRPGGSHPLAAALRARSDAGCETHLTIRDLRRLDTWAAGAPEVWVCENPRVLEAAMDAGAVRPMVCTAGNPRLVVSTLLTRLVDGGTTLHYRGDFDWPGVAIANRVVGTHGALPWRMGEADYRAAIAASAASLDDLPALGGAPVEAVWDAGLSPAMVRTGRAVHEEALLDVLVADLLA